jgi:hypothetical protein
MLEDFLPAGDYMQNRLARRVVKKVRKITKVKRG